MLLLLTGFIPPSVPHGGLQLVQAGRPPQEGLPGGVQESGAGAVARHDGEVPQNAQPNLRTVLQYVCSSFLSASTKYSVQSTRFNVFKWKSV